MRLLCVPLAAVLALGLTAQDQVTVFRGATILPADGPAIEQGVLVIAGGRIQLVGGPDTQVPQGAVMIDSTGKFITPGLVDASAPLALAASDANEQGTEVTPHMRILDAMDLGDPSFAQARRTGVTTLNLMPGTRNVIGGFGVVLKTAGDTLEEMLLKEDSALRIVLGRDPASGNTTFRGLVNSMYARRPTTAMGTVWEVRKAFYDAMAYKERKTIDTGSSESDPGMDVLVDVLDGRVQAHTVARSEPDIRTALRLGGEFGFQTVLDEAAEAWAVVDELAAADARLLISAPSSLQSPGDGAEVRLDTLKLLADRGITFAIQSGRPRGAGGGGRGGRRGRRGGIVAPPAASAQVDPPNLMHEAIFAMRNGLTPEQALNAITIAPAQILGIDARVGSLTPGKDADLVIWNNDPFDPTADIEAVYIGGVRVHGR